jgi:hypothetical protein
VTFDIARQATSNRRLEDVGPEARASKETARLDGARAVPDAAPPARMRTITVIVLTYNEAQRLRPCLESVRWADEIIVIDGHSTDDTTKLAQEFTPHIYLSDLLGPKNPGGFSDQRNFGLSKASGDWVFFLDADERVTPQLRTEIEERLLGDVDEGHVVYRVPRLEHFFGVPSPYTHGDGRQWRMMRRGRAQWNHRLVHEGLVFEGTAGDLVQPMLHYSKDTVGQYIATMNRYTALEAEELMKAGTPLARSPWPSMCHTFLHRYINMRSYREGTFGLLMSLMLTFYQFLVWTKHWELCKNQGLVPKVTRPRPMASAVYQCWSGLWHALSNVKRAMRRIVSRSSEKPPGK